MRRREARVVLFALAWTIGSAGRAPSQQELWHVDGAVCHNFGNTTLDTSADFDGDGVVDLVTSDPDAGAAIVLSGSSGSELFRIGGSKGEAFGASAAAIADIDADGVTDLSVGAPRFVRTGDAGPCGRVSLFSGRTLKVIAHLEGEHGDAIFPDSFGSLVRGLDDLDGDGLPELLVSAEGYGRYAGRVYVYSASTRSLLRTHDAAGGEDYFGERAARLGDVDSDGVGDYAVGASTGGAEGVVHVYSGATGALLFTWQGTGSDFLGMTLSAGGDWDGDGHADVLVGAPDTSSSKPGSVYLYSGADGSVLWQIDGERIGAQFGRTGALLGDDLEGDGFDEYVISAGVDQPGVSGDVGEITIYSGATLRPLCRLRAPPDRQIWRLAAGIDANGDGLGDFIEVVDAPTYCVRRIECHAGNDLFLVSTDNDPAPEESIELNVAGGASGALAVLVIEAVDGTPAWSTIAITVLDPFGEFVYATDIPSEASGMEFTLRAYAQDLRRGHGALDSSPEPIRVQ